MSGALTGTSSVFDPTRSVQQPTTSSQGTPASTGQQPPAQNAQELPSEVRQILDELKNALGNQGSRNNQQQSFQDSNALTSMMAILALMLSLPAILGGMFRGGIGFMFGIFGGGMTGGLGSALAAQNEINAAKDPMTLDMDGNGQTDMTSVEDGVQFDIDGDGVKEQVAWSKAKGDDTDGFLTLDKNGNGEIDNGTELFGDQNGKANGFEELKRYDSNKDGVIDKQDSVYNQLKVWQDKNHDGISQADEMKSLQDAGVEKVNLDYSNSNQQDQFGNQFRQQGAFTRTNQSAQQIAQRRGTTVENAKTGKVADAWVQTKK